MSRMWRVYRAVLVAPLTFAYTVFAVVNVRKVFTKAAHEDVLDILGTLTAQFFDELPPAS